MRLGRYLGDAVYGALDGIVTTFAIVAGVAGASMGSSIILILGIANLLADGISMAAGNYLSKRSEQEYKLREEEEELAAIDSDPLVQRQKVERIYAAKGFSGEQLTGLVATITSDKRRWASEIVDGGHRTAVSPVVAGLTTFFSFVIIGAMPLLSYILAIGFPALANHSFLAACILTGITIFAVGSARSVIISQSWWRAGLEMLVVGGLAAAAAYGIGSLLSGVF